MSVPLIVAATGNAHKVGEIRQILGGCCRLLAMADFPGAPAVVEDAETFRGNAQKKSESLAHWLAAHPPNGGADYALADDSGLETDALKGAPGVHSARFAAEKASTSGNMPDAANNAKLLRLLADVPLEKRKGRFRCVLALTSVKDQTTDFFEGACPGRIALQPGGGGGFGYDPLFVPDGFAESFARLGESVKNKISHRARALEKLRDFLAARAG